MDDKMKATQELTASEKATSYKWLALLHLGFSGFQHDDDGSERIYRDHVPRHRGDLCRRFRGQARGLPYWHQSFFNTHTVAFNFIAGLVYALEKDLKAGKVAPTVIDAAKASLMGSDCGNVRFPVFQLPARNRCGSRHGPVRSGQRTGCARLHLDLWRESVRTEVHPVAAGIHVGHIGNRCRFRERSHASCRQGRLHLGPHYGGGHDGDDRQRTACMDVGFRRYGSRSEICWTVLTRNSEYRDCHGLHVADEEGRPVDCGSFSGSSQSPFWAPSSACFSDSEWESGRWPNEWARCDIRR